MGSTTRHGMISQKDDVTLAISCHYLMKSVKPHENIMCKRVIAIYHHSSPLELIPLKLEHSPCFPHSKSSMSPNCSYDLPLAARKLKRWSPVTRLPRAARATMAQALIVGNPAIINGGCLLPGLICLIVSLDQKLCRSRWSRMALCGTAGMKNLSMSE